MPSSSLSDSLVEDRVAQLEAISQRRNALLREMYHLMRRRQNVGHVFKLNEADEEDLPKFLDRLDLRKNPETGTLANLLDSEMAVPGSPRRPYEVRTRSRSMAKAVVPNVKPSASDPAAERRASLRRDVRRSDPRNNDRVDQKASVSLPETRFAVKTGDEAESDDILAMEPPSGQQSQRHSASLPPHHYQDEDDDDRDELDLISPSPRSGTSYEPRTRSSTMARSRSRSAVIDISDSASPVEVLESETHEDGVVDSFPPKPEEITEVNRNTPIQIVDEEGQSVPERVRVEARQAQVSSKGSLQDHGHVQHDYVLAEQTPTSVVEDVDMIVRENGTVADGYSTQLAGLQGGSGTPMKNDISRDISRTVVVPGAILERAQDSMTATQRFLASESRDIAMRLDDAAVQVTHLSKSYPHQLTIAPVQTIRSISIPAPSPSVATISSYDFNVDAKPVLSRHLASTENPHHFNPQYTLPSVKSLPIEFQRRSKFAKQQRKREKEREKNEIFDKNDGRREGKEDSVPMGWNRWAATLHANSVWKKVARAPKCLSTRDWSVAVTELKLVRTFEHVEALKNGQWSFRQPKKQRGLGGLTKTHWDYLLDEMKWMRIDFREERKWKIMLAYNLAKAVLEWHEAGGLEERVRQGICVLWKPSQISELDESPVESAVDRMDVDSSPQMKDADSLAAVDYGSDDDDDDEDQEKDQDMVDVLEPSAVIQEALDQPSQNVVKPEPLGPKEEELDDSSALQTVTQDNEHVALDAGAATQETMEVDDTPKVEEALISDSASLKPTSTDPILASDPKSTVGGPGSSKVKSSNKSKLYAPLRERIAYSDERKLFLDLDDLDLTQILPAEESTLEALPPPLDLSAIFPDLPVYGLLDVTPPITPGLTSEGKKKSEKKSERDDPNKRAEDTTYTKLAPLGRFMSCKPTLLGALQPVRHWRDGQWYNLDESPVTWEGDGALVKPPDDITCDLFEGSKAGNPQSYHPPTQPALPRKRVDHLWTERDDALLKATIERYPSNWALICDVFNSSRLTISTDKRTPGECLERWLTLREAEKPPSLTPTQTMMTRGVKRPVTASISGVGTNGSLSLASGFEPKKRRRHYLMYEAIRKAARKRELEKKSSMSQRKPSAVHDTHGQYNKLPKLTPAELSRLKAEKEQREDEFMLSKRRQEEFARQMRDQAHRMQVPPNLQAQMLQQQQPQQQSLPQQQVNGATRLPGLGIAAGQGVPQIRNISQQQRIPTVNARLSPHQMIQVQAQAAQARAMAVVQAQVQAQAQAQATQAQVQAQAPSTNINNVVAHMSPPYTSRAATSSPAQSSPPRNANTPSNAVNSPRPPSAQPPASMAPVSQVPGGAIRPPNNLGNLGHFFPAVSSTQFTPEQMEQALRFQSLLQAQRQVGIAQSNQSSSYAPQS